MSRAPFAAGAATKPFDFQPRRCAAAPSPAKFYACHGPDEGRPKVQVFSGLEPVKEEALKKRPSKIKNP